MGFSDGSDIRAEREPTGLTIKSKSKHWTLPTSRILREQHHARSALIERELLFRRHRDLLFSEELELRRLAEWDPQLEKYLRSSDQPDWVTALSKKLPVLYVTDRRLVLEPPPEGQARRRPESVTTGAAVDQAVEHIKSLMSSALSEFAAESQRLDRDFPQRVVAAMKEGVQISDTQLQHMLDSNDQTANLLQQVGLLPKNVETRSLMDFSAAEVKPVIATHAADTRRKLAVLNPLRQRLTLFKDFLSQHYQTKTLVLDSAVGFTIATDRDSISPSELSSGEQQILVLAYQILFRAEPGTLLLIDEPELSLHVMWQDSFIEDITRMGTERSLRFLLATHSPTLIGGRTDLRRSMDVKPTT